MDRNIKEVPVWQIELVNTDEAESTHSYLLSEITLEVFTEDARSRRKTAVNVKEAVASITEIKSLRQPNNPIQSSIDAVNPILLGHF